MKVNDRTIDALVNIATGDNDKSPYRKGPVLVKFFNHFGFEDIYGQGFPSRKDFAEEKLQSLNGKPIMRDIIEALVDPREYEDGDNDYFTASDAAIYLNKFLIHDGFKLVPSERKPALTEQDIIEYQELGIETLGVPPEIYVENLREDFFKLKAISNTLIVETALVHLSHEYVNDQIRKAKQKLQDLDYDGAITNARTLIEIVLKDLAGQLSITDKSMDSGDLVKMYKVVRSKMNLDVQKDMEDTLKQILQGFASIVTGLAGMSNKMGDRHARTYAPSKHHAELAINSAFTLCEFLITSYQHQKIKSEK